MRYPKLVAVAALMIAAFSGGASAQETTMADEKFFKSPVFLLMPGGLTTCVISCDVGDSNTDFNFRFQTVLPTSQSWLAFVAGLQWGWADEDAHGPIGFFGAIIPINPINRATNGWLSVSLDPLGVVAGPGGDGTNFVMEAAFVLNLGAMMVKDPTGYKGWGAYFLVDQQLTNVGRDADGDKDYWNPALVWGVFFQIAP